MARVGVKWLRRSAQKTDCIVQMAGGVGGVERNKRLTLFSLLSLSVHSCSASLLYTIIPFIQCKYSYSYWVNVDLLSVSDTPVSGVLCD